MILGTLLNIFLELTEARFVSKFRYNIHLFSTGIVITHVIKIFTHFEVSENDKLFFEGGAELFSEFELIHCFLLLIQVI